MTVLKRLTTGLTRGVSRDDVFWCYRTFLRREPESEEVVRYYSAVKDLRTLVLYFIGSEEYASVRSLRTFRPLPLPHQRIDVDVDADRLAAIVAKVKAAWTHMGELRPHFSVLTNDAFLPHNLPQTIDQFWASGEVEAARVLSIADAYGLATEGKTCVEFGCGVGRLTGTLAPHFARYHAYDISATHLAQAQERMDALGLAQVALVHWGETGLETLAPCDLFYSRIVFQHNPPPLMALLVRQALAAVVPGGLAIFQLPTFAEGYSFDIDEWLLAGHTLEMEMHCLPQRHVFEAIASAGCVALEVCEDDSVGDPRYVSNTFVVRRPVRAEAGDLGVHREPDARDPR